MQGSHVYNSLQELRQLRAALAAQRVPDLSAIVALRLLLKCAERSCDSDNVDAASDYVREALRHLDKAYPLPVAPSGEEANPTSDQCRIGESMADDYFQHVVECQECSAYEAARVASIRGAAPRVPDPPGLVELVREWRDLIAELASFPTLEQGGSWAAGRAVEHVSAMKRWDALMKKLLAVALPEPPASKEDALLGEQMFEAVKTKYDALVELVREIQTTVAEDVAAGYHWSTRQQELLNRLLAVALPEQPKENP